VREANYLSNLARPAIRKSRERIKEARANESAAWSSSGSPRNQKTLLDFSSLALYSSTLLNLITSTLNNFTYGAAVLDAAFWRELGTYDWDDNLLPTYYMHTVRDGRVFCASFYILGPIDIWLVSCFYFQLLWFIPWQSTLHFQRYFGVLQTWKGAIQKNISTKLLHMHLNFSPGFGKIIALRTRCAGGYFRNVLIF